MYTKMFAGGFTTDLKSMTNQQDQRILTVFFRLYRDLQYKEDSTKLRE